MKNRLKSCCPLVVALVLACLLAACSSEPSDPEVSSDSDSTDIAVESSVLNSRGPEQAWVEGIDVYTCLEAAHEYDRLHDPLRTRGPEQDWVLEIDSEQYLAAVREYEQRQRAKMRPRHATLACPKPKRIRSKKKSPPKFTGPITIELARTQFKAFARSWVNKVTRNMRGTVGNMDVAQEPQGYVARFTEVDPGSMVMEVKPSASGGKKCPFIGVLRYHERYFEARHDNAEEVRKGPFAKVKTQRVTEIFRFVSGRWTN